MVARNMRLQFRTINTRHGELVVCSTIRMPDKLHDNADTVQIDGIIYEYFKLWNL